MHSDLVHKHKLLVLVIYLCVHLLFSDLLSGTASTTLTCVIYGGVNSNTIKWQHDGQEISVDNLKYRLLSNTRLEIKGISSSDEGLYSCSYDVNGYRQNRNIVCIYVLGE